MPQFKLRLLGRFVRAREVPAGHTLPLFTVPEETVGWVEVAPPGRSGARCKNGHYFKPISDWAPKARACLHPGCAEREDVESVALRVSQIPLVLNPWFSRRRHWWHSSAAHELTTTDPVDSGEDWLMHVGTRSAALQRALADRRSGVPQYLHRVVLADAARIAPETVLENQYRDPMHVLLHVRGDRSVVRYVNAREDAGSVSLAGRRARFRSVATLPLRAGG